MKLDPYPFQVAPQGWFRAILMLEILRDGCWEDLGRPPWASYPRDRKGLLYLMLLPDLDSQARDLYGFVV